MYKLTVYVPATHLEGQGQFRPLAGSSPFIGQADSVATVDEYRVEMLCPEDRASAVIRALRAAHPYEAPAFDLVHLLDLTTRC